MKRKEVKNIVAELRSLNQGCPLDAEASHCIVEDLLHLADRIEAAVDLPLEIDMEENASKHLEFSVSESKDGRFSVVEHFTDGTKMIYAGFPSREDAEEFVLAQPECWEDWRSE